MELYFFAQIDQFSLEVFSVFWRLYNKNKVLKGAQFGIMKFPYELNCINSTQFQHWAALLFLVRKGATTAYFWMVGNQANVTDEMKRFITKGDGNIFGLLNFARVVKNELRILFSVVV